MAGSHPLIIQYIKPVLSGIDGVFEEIENAEVLKEFSEPLRKTFVDQQLKSLPPITIAQLHETLGPEQVKYRQLTSKKLIFTKGKLKVTVYISLELESYIAVIKKDKCKTVKVLGYTESSKKATSTHQLFSLLKKQKLISASFEENQPLFNNVLDFNSLYHDLKPYLEENVIISIINELPTEAEISEKHQTTHYFDEKGFSFIEIIDFHGEFYLIYLFVYYDEHEKFNSLLKRPYNFSLLHSAFSAPSEVRREIAIELEKKYNFRFF